MVAHEGYKNNSGNRENNGGDYENDGFSGATSPIAFSPRHIFHRIHALIFREGRMRPDWSDLAPYLPPAFGALVGLRWAKDQTPAQKVASFAMGFGLAVYFGPAIAELFSLGPKATVAVGILTAIVGMDVIGGLMAAAAAFRANPLGAFREWWSAWWSRGQS